MSKDAISLLITLVTGGIGGAYFGYRLAIRSEKRRIRREFRKWLVEFKSRIDTCGKFGVIAGEWTNTRHVFAGKADEARESVRWWRRTGYDKSVVRVQGITPGEVDETAKDQRGQAPLLGNEKLSKAIGAVMRFLR